MTKRIAIAGLLCLAAMGRAQTNDKATAFAWLDSLKVEGLNPGSFVKIEPFAKGLDGKTVTLVATYGFESGRTEAEINVVTLRLNRVSYMLKAEKGSYLYAAKTTRADFLKWARERFPKVKEVAEKGIWPGDYNDRPSRVETFVLARLLDKIDPALSDAYYGLLPTWWTYTGWQSQGILEDVKNDLSQSLGMEAGDAFMDPHRSLQEIEGRLRWYADHFSDAYMAKAISGLVPQVESLIAEARTHVVKPWSQMTKQEQIAELVYRLRDIRTLWGPPPAKSPVAKDGTPLDARAALLDIGFPAVPALIEAIADARPSHVYPMGGSGPGPFPPLPIGRVAHDILGAISGHYFNGKGGGTVEEMLADEQKQAREWWAKAEPKGERQALIDEVLAGNALPAWRLVDRYPKDAEATLVAALKSAPSADLVSALGRIDTASAHQAERELMTGGTTPEIRWAGIWCVQYFDLDAAVQAAIAELPKAGEGMDPNDYRVAQRFSFLFGAGRLAGIQAVEKYFAQLTPDRRAQVLFGIAEGRFGSPLGISNRNPFREQPAPIAEQKAFEAELERFLAAILEVEDRCSFYGNTLDFRYYHPRLADLASYTLGMLWPKKYERPRGASPLDFEDVRVHNQNVWRERQGQTPLPTPARPQIERVPAAQIDPLLADYRAAQTDAAREKAAAAIEAKGLGALPAVQAEASRHPEFVPLAARMANIVRERQLVNVPDSGIAYPLFPSSGPVKGKPLTSEAIGALLADFAQKSRGAMEVRILRGADSSGITVTLTFGKRTEPNSLQYSQWVGVDGITLTSESGSLGTGASPRPQTWSNFLSALQKGLESDSSKTVEAVFTLGRF